MASPTRSNECYSLELLGVGNSRTVRDLTALVQSYHPKLVFLLETRQSEQKMKNLSWRIGLKGCLAMGSDGNSGGIALFWDESISIKLIGMCNRIIDVTVQECPTSPPFRVTFIYGEPRVENRKKMWELL